MIGSPNLAGDAQYLCGVFRSVPLKFVLKRKQNSPHLVFNPESRAPGPAQVAGARPPVPFDPKALHLLVRGASGCTLLLVNLYV